MPVRWTRISTSLIPISGSGTVSRLRPGPGAVFTRASMGAPAFLAPGPFDPAAPSDILARIVGPVDDRILHHADALDLAPDAVAGLEEHGGSRNTPTPAGVPVAIRSPGSSVMWREMKRDERRHAEHHVGGRAVLHRDGLGRRRARCRGCATSGASARPPGRPRPASRTRARSGGRCRCPWRAATGRRPSRPRAAPRVALPVAGADVVDDDIARDVVHRLGLRHAPRRAPDHDAQLDLEVQRAGALRPDDRHRRRR